LALVGAAIFWELRREAIGLGCVLTYGEHKAFSRRGEGAGVQNAARRGCALFAAVAAATLGSPFLWPSGTPARAQVVEDVGSPVRHIVVTVNKSRTLRFNQPFTSAVIGAPEIADVLPMTQSTLYIQGKKIGTTNISAFDAQKHLVAVVDLEVTPDTGSLRSKIMASTGSRNISVGSVNGEVVLSGEASDAVSAARAVDVAAGLSGKEPVINAMRVAPSQQVMLKVRFLEVDRNAGRDFGINWFGGNKNGIGFSGLGAVANSATAVRSTTQINGASANVSGTGIGIAGNNLASPLQGVPLVGGVFPGAAATATPFGALLANVINTHGLQISTMISALEDKGLVKTLAEPDLVAQSGEKASFFAGAEIPVPTVQPGTIGTTPTVSVQYYNCGVTLNFVPTVLNSGLINLHLGPQVCQVATTTPVVVNGTTIPELTTRSADTTVGLRDGQSFAIAGLLQAQDVNDLSQLPWIGSVPVLGALFRSTNYQKAETDLVVIVTVHLVRPVAPNTHLVTPFDTTLSANDVDLFLMGDTERQKRYTDFVTNGGGLGLQGPYGHILEAR
jgi:pilus assembly protein CpaC